MLNTIDNLLKEDKLLECISFIRENTNCFSLIKTLCDYATKLPINKTYQFWNDYAIAYYYLNDKTNSYKCYDNIFAYNKTTLNTESDVEFYFKNMMFSFPNTNNNSNTISLQSLLNENISIIPYSDNVKKYINLFNPLNPSIIKDNNNYLMNVRTVNYSFDNNFRYITNGLCKTINYIFCLDQNFDIISCSKLNYKDMPYSGDFDGWEDIRLFNYDNKIYCSFTTLQATENRLQTICISDITDNNNNNYHIPLNNYGNKKIQKNWVPIQSKSKELFFIYSFFPLIVLKYENNNVILHQVSKTELYNKWRGGSPAINLGELGYENYYLCIIHESEFPKYKHKFVLLEEIKENIFEIKKESNFFYFIDEIIEFCSGLVISHCKNNFILTFGKMDREIYYTQINTQLLLKLFF